jgi:hypothetical protein
MSEAVSRRVLQALVVVHLGLAVWSLIGLAEFVLPAVPWRRIANPLFSPAVLLAQWLLVLGTAAIFVGGYARRWRYTPLAVGVGYGLMASLCVYQTFFILIHEMRFVPLGAEFAAYVSILALLHRSPARERFSGSSD